VVRNDEKRRELLGVGRWHVANRGVLRELAICSPTGISRDASDLPLH